MKTVAIIQARMGSTRLPGKVMMQVLGKPLLEHMIERLGRLRTLDEIVIATTLEPRDQIICDFAKEKNYLFGCGSEWDVLDRYYQIAKAREAEIVVRMTSDCPLIDPEISDMVVQRHLSSGRNDMTSNVLQLSFPNGFDTEVLSWACLEKVHQEARDAVYREHVTNFIHDYPEKFTLENVISPENRAGLRLCVDTAEDFELIRRIFEALYPRKQDFGFRDIYELLDENPRLKKINAHIEQTKILKRQMVP